MRLVEHIFSLVSLVSLFILGPGLGRALLLWWDKRRERSPPSQHIVVAVTGLITGYGLIWEANPKMVAWYSWIYYVPISGDVFATVNGSIDVSGSVDTSH